MKSRWKRKLSTGGGLIAFNAALLGILALVTFAGPSVEARFDAAATSAISGAAGAGDYIMVGGKINGNTNNALYVLDQRSGVMICFVYDSSNHKLRGQDVRSVVNDSKRVEPSK